MQPLGRLREDDEAVRDRAPFIRSINMTVPSSFRVNTESIRLVIKAIKLKVFGFCFHLSASRKQLRRTCRRWDRKVSRLSHLRTLFHFNTSYRNNLNKYQGSLWACYRISHALWLWLYPNSLCMFPVFFLICPSDLFLTCHPVVIIKQGSSWC